MSSPIRNLQENEKNNRKNSRDEEMKKKEKEVSACLKRGNKIEMENDYQAEEILWLKKLRYDVMR